MDIMNKYPYHIGIRVSKSTYNALQDKLERRGSDKLEPLVREILDKFADTERAVELKGLIDKQVEWLENNGGQ